MENKVEIQDGQLIVVPQGVTKLAAVKDEIIVPLDHVVGASIDTGILNDRKGLKMPGTAMPGYWAGSFHKDSEITFFNVKQSSTPIVIQLKDDKYSRLVLGTENPRNLVELINNAI
ncbi:hypothetical protein FE410_06130 [Leuconostoc carnosum]|uniref:Bacterial Pleckstrin homology domain-containing protein n=2 Tax=Leuconostoc carnosum TaxID=1252 RepID=K0DEJ1_LEUCJ|nr:hypothetical protein [Leuconostoc carnosum]AFT82082.1 hypothetical protein C270_05865 [Leuconostoc carnosum JB16]KAA8328649.1 hypothetical protein FE409_06200 [Leuconostoc carnosum]KAA8371266.1 hypothetical protein FE414_06125 [Leuconostoc carnosum]KAA8382904.1 hypothetical protein FE410_06130 [Leuconostoc carnosum]QEA33875.1 hypothetical protein FGL89_06955 [Leuconostoc carnosum]